MLQQAVAVCLAHGVEIAVLCPGSRSAPIALSFMRFNGIRHYVIPDERVAAYTALGISRQLRKPVAIVCTSGTAALNFAPAVAEAFFSEIPLIVITADRPVEWIGQTDNQAIYQENLYGKNVKASFSLPADLAHPDSEWYAIRQVNEALNIAISQPKGPVHINVPLREPLYLIGNQTVEGEAPKVTHVVRSGKPMPEHIPERLSRFQKVLVIAGTHRPNEKLLNYIQSACSEKHLVFIPDITSNLIEVNGAVQFAEIIVDSLTASDKDNYAPDLLISFGGPVVSKSLKDFLREHKSMEHWHLSGHPSSADVFQNLTHIFDISAPEFFKGISEDSSVSFNRDFFGLWHKMNPGITTGMEKVFEGLPYSEIKVTDIICKSLPQSTVLHLGNSLPVRFASVFGRFQNKTEIYSNRGTSGIDGTLSSAAGHSMVDDRIHVLICGDLSFMYDSNGLWNNYLKDNLKIIIFNNHGGGIFRNLPGARDQAELEEYFVVKQALNFEHTALQHGCHYFYCKDTAGLHPALNELFAAKGKPAVLEIEFENSISIEEVKGLVKKRL
jgi:2-succinyl-5-enolpyruvyl-6-hydroxy-3-cyclohexene-1-carboxylate synthase